MKELMVKLLALSWLVMVYFLFSWTFASAYTTPQKSVNVVIDHYGEAEVELVMLLLSAPFVLGGAALVARDALRKFEEKARLRAM